MADQAAAGLVGIRDAADLGNLRLIVAGLSEGVLLIDPDQTILWANYAALRMHGVGELDGLGGTVDEYRRRFELRYRNNHKLDAGEYPIARVVSGETFTEVTVEVAPTGENETHWVHQIRSIVLVDKKGDPECLVLVMLDVTEQCDAEERFSQAFNANPAPALIGRLSDLRIIKANQGFLDMTGFERDQLVGRTVYEVDLFGRAAHREVAHERLAEGRAVPQMESELALPDGTDKLVILAGQPIVYADQDCMLFTFADLEPRRKAETAMRHSEERFQQAFQLAPVAMVVASRNRHMLFHANRAFQDMTGYADDRLVGRTAGEIMLWDTAATRRRLEEQVETTGSFRNVDAKVRTCDGGLLDCLVSAATVDMAGDASVLWVIQDITERRQSELELVTAIETVMADASWFSRNVVEKLANLRAQQSGAPTKEITELTAREKEVLSLVCQGKDDATIAETLVMSRTTVRNHVARIYGKIGVNKRGAAIVWARERGLAKAPVRPARRT